MPLPKATSPKLPGAIGAVTLMITTRGAGEVATGTFEIQVLDGSGGGQEYERIRGSLSQLSPSARAAAQKVSDAFRKQADTELFSKE